MENKIKQKYFCRRKINYIAPRSAVALVGLFGLMLFPVSFAMDSTEAAPVQSTTTLTLSTSDLSAEITPSSTEGTFVTSDPATISVVTNNYSGYTLGISANDDINNTKLINTNDDTAYLNSISSASSVEEFNANNWGYLPSKLNSQANANYQPAPTTTATTLDATNVANAEANTYTIALGAKADYSLPSGTYENSFTLTAVANPVNYTITYNKNTEDEVTNMPENQSGSIEDTDITIPNTTPTRTLYVFQGWCNVTSSTNNGIDSCSGTTYQPGDTIDMNKTTANDTTLYALWQIDTFTQTTEVRYEVANADGTYGSYTTVDTQEVPRGSTYSWSTSQISGFDTATYNSASVTAYTVTEAHTNQVDITRKSYTLTIDRNTSYIASTTGTGTYKVGKVVSISATVSSGNRFTGWSQTAGTASSFGSTTSASTTFTMPASAATIYADGFQKYIQNVTTATCPTAVTIVYDNRDETPYHIQKLADGKCWMLDNLALDLTDSTVKSNLSASNTNASATSISKLINGGGTTSDKYATAGVANWTTSYSYSAPLVNLTNKDVVPSNASTNGKGYNKVGGYYNFCAASAGSYCYGNGTDPGTITFKPRDDEASYDICPNNWRMPTSNTGEYGALANAIYGSTGDTGDATAIANYRNALSLPFSGSFNNGSARGQGSDGSFWSKIQYSSDSFNKENELSDMYSLGVSTSHVTPSDFDDRKDGLSVRCLARV